MEKGPPRNAAHRSLAGGLVTAAITASCSVPSAPAVPATLAVDPQQRLLLSAGARGAQIYQCLANKNDTTHFAWTLTGPEASLFDASGHIVGRHYAGPTWELDDGSKVVGAVLAREAGPDPNAIPWLLLSAQSASGAGLLSNTKIIQRINTSGGKAPAEGCDASAAGAVIRVPYTATYRFYGSDSR